METMIPPQFGMRLRTKKRGQKNERTPNKKNERKESLLYCHFHILVVIFHYGTWLVYSNDGLPQNALGLHEQASWMHTHLVSFVELSHTYSSSASVARQSLLTHIDIY